MAEEIWRPIPSLPGYSASCLGRIRRDIARAHFRNPRILKCTRFTEGYLALQTTINGKKVTFGAHVLVCEAFNGPRPPEATLVRHLDDIPDNNVPSNLAWGTEADNAADAKRNGRLPMGERHGNAKLIDADVIRLFEMRADGMTGAQIGAVFGLNRNTANKVIARGTYGHVHLPPDLIQRVDRVNSARTGKRCG